MTPLTPDQRASLDAMAATAIHDPEAAIGVSFQAGQVAEALRKHGIDAHVGIALTGAWTNVWIYVGPTSAHRLSEALTAIDLAEDETRHREHPHGWHDIHLQGVDAPLFALLDPTAEAIPA